MEIYRAYKTELDPNEAQKVLLAKSVGTARFAYNWGLNRIKETFGKKEKMPTAIDLHKKLCSLKVTDFPWMYEVSKCCKEYSCRRQFVGDTKRLWTGKGSSSRDETGTNPYGTKFHKLETDGNKC
jgi:transposase